MNTVDAVKPARAPFERLLAALTDPARSERTMALLLGGYLAAWTLYGAIAKSSQDINFDMGEMYLWSEEFILGTAKHPPLGAWLVGAWFDVFPRQDWAYYLFAMLMATAALWVAWHLSARWLAPEKRVVGLLLLTFVPFYNFHALKFNANTVLIPLWAVTTWWWLRSFETRGFGWSVLAGIGAAASMLGKYWSIFLLAGLAVAALADPRRAAYFRSPAPWVTVAAGAAALAPHLAWIVTHDFLPFRYALVVHAGTLMDAVAASIGYVAGALGYIAIALVAVLMAARPSMAAVCDTLWPADRERRTAIVAFAVPILLPALVAVALEVKIVSLWTMSAMTLLPAVLLSSPLVVIPRVNAVRLLAVAIVLPLLMIAVAPVAALLIHRNGVMQYAAHYRLIAQALENAWRERTEAPLRMVASDETLNNGITFYLQGKPSSLDLLVPQPPDLDDRIAREGVAIVCAALNGGCLATMDMYGARHPGAQTEDIVLAPRHFGTPGQEARFRIMIIPAAR